MSSPSTIFFLRLFCLLATWSAGSRAVAEPRTFTNKEGRSITAEAIDFDTGANTVTLRTGDGRTFAISIPSLSLDDQAYLAESRRQIAAATDPGGWKNVEVRLPVPQSHVSAPGIYGAFYRTGATTWSGELPEGAWIQIKRVVAKGEGDYISDPELLLRFDGSWKALSITFRDGHFLASFDGGEPLLVGVTCKVVPTPAPDFAAPNRSYFDRTKTEELQLKFFETILQEIPEGRRICLQPASYLRDPLLRRYRGKVDAIIAHSQSTSENARLIDELELRAFKTAPEGSLREIEKSKTLEFLSLGQTPEDIRPVISHPSLSTLELSLIRTQGDLDTIAENPGLRFVKINHSTDSSTTYVIDRWADLKSLTGIDFPERSCFLSTASVSKCSSLRTVRFEDPGAGPLADWMIPLKSPRNVRWSSKLGAKQLMDFAATAETAKAIRFVWNFNTTPLASLPSLRALEMPGASRQETWSATRADGLQMKRMGLRPYVWPMKGIETAENLEYLAVSGVDQTMIDLLVTKKNPGSLKVLILASLVDCTDLSGLAVFENLRILVINSLFESFPEDDSKHLKEIDLTKLKSLEVVEVLPFYESRDITPVTVKVGEVPFRRILDDNRASDYLPWGDSEAR